MSAPAPEDWQAKPVEAWTAADFIAEARWQIRDHLRRLKRWRADTPVATALGVEAGLRWWRRELASLEAA